MKVAYTNLHAYYNLREYAHMYIVKLNREGGARWYLRDSVAF